MLKLLVLFIVLFLAGCGQNNEKVPIDNLKFDQDVIASNQTISLRVDNYEDKVASILSDINSTYATSDFNQVTQHQLASITLDDLETNSTLKQGVAAYEKLLPKYLAQTPIFSQEVFDANDVYQTNIIFIKYNFQAFMNASILHLRLLKQRKDMKQFYRVVQANLKNLNILAKGSNSTIDYIYAITFYKSIFDEIAELSLDYEVCMFLDNNPPLGEETFFEILENEKMKTYALTQDTLLKPDDKLEQRPQYVQLMRTVFERFKGYYSDYEKKYINAVKSGSKEEMKEFNAYMKQEKEDFVSMSSRVVMIYESLKTKAQAFFGLKVDYYAVGGSIGKALALVAVPKLHPVFKKHKNVVKQHRNLYLSCSKKND